MARYLLAFATSEGQTERIAERIAIRLRLAGHDVTTSEIDELGDVELTRFDAVVLGGSVHYGHHQKRLRRFIETHRDRLNDRPTAVFSVSGAAIDSGGGGARAARGYLGELTTDLGWQPTEQVTFAGAVVFTRYWLLKRLMMKRIMSSKGLAADTRRDYDYTDWDAVDAFADGLTGLTQSESTPAGSSRAM